VSELLANYEKYLQGEPLNDELRDVRDGKVLLTEPAHPVQKEQAKQEREEADGLLNWEPSRKELVALNEMAAGEGWAVLMRLLEKRLEFERETAIKLSQVNPLRNSEAICEAWAYHGKLQQVVRGIGPMLKEQLKRLREEE